MNNLTTPKTLPDVLENETQINWRRLLLPWWIKIFVWICFAFLVVSPISFLFGLLGYQFQLALYGLETDSPVSGIGISVLLLFFYKGVVSYGLWMQKKWGAAVAIIDGLLGIIVCASVMTNQYLASGNVAIRLELLLLIPYLIKMTKIKRQWRSSAI